MSFWLFMVIHVYLIFPTLVAHINPVIILWPVSLLQFEVSKRKWCTGLAWDWEKRLQWGGTP